MYITDKQIDSLRQAIHFIAHNSDGATDHKPYQKMMADLTAIWKKGIKELKRRKKHTNRLNPVHPFPVGEDN